MNREPLRMLEWWPGIVPHLALLVLVWWPELPPSTDGPTHLGMASALAAGVEASGVDTNWTLTTQLFVRLVSLFACVAPPYVAYRAGLTVLTLGLSVGVTWLARESGARVSRALVASPLVAVGFVYAMGFHNFLLGCAVGVVLVAAMVRNASADERSSAPASLAGLVVLGALTAHAHVVAWAMAVVHGGLLVLLQEERSAKRFVRLVATQLPALALTLAVLLALGATESGALPTMQGAGIPLSERVIRGLVIGRDGFALAGIPLALALWAAALLAARAPGARAPLALAALWLFGGIVLPFHIRGWAYVSPRLLIWAGISLAHAAAYAELRVTHAWAIALLGSLGLLIEAEEQSHVSESTLASAELIGEAITGTPMSARVSIPAYGLGDHITPAIHIDELGAGAGEFPSPYARFNSTMHSVHFADPSSLPPASAGFVFRSFRCGGEAHVQAECDADHRNYADRTAVQSMRWDGLIAINPTTAYSDQLALRGFEELAPARWQASPTRIPLVLRGAPGTRVELVAGLESVGPYAGVRGVIDESGEVQLEVGGLVHGPNVVELRVARPGDSQTQPIIRELLQLPLDQPLFVDLTEPSQ